MTAPEQQAVYPSYNGLSRVAMVWGVPLVASIAILMFSIVCAAIAAAILGAGGVFFASVGIPIWIYCKQICETDDQAMWITALEILSFMKRWNKKVFGNTYTLSPIKFGRSKHVYKRHLTESTGD
jgi:type IV secretion system protein VirB3